MKCIALERYNVARRIDDLLTLMDFPYHEQNYLQGFTKHANMPYCYASGTMGLYVGPLVNQPIEFMLTQNTCPC